MVSESGNTYTVLARRFRPQSFHEVVGQEHVGQAIQNAIRSGRVAHAYLFTGARGVGKTSTARIFAKALNCPNAKDGIPCNECDVCQRISAGHDVDVLEIDGASNRGIDDIRQLRANVSVRSMRSPYKVYIIDEVHMLTKEAFNALLKTLEEPPPNVKFVFCTTEPNKVPDTILSRCQRFDFGTIAQESIATRLKQIAEAEGKQVDDEAVELVARRANGSMRDSQSLFDQLLAFGDDRITTDDVHQLLGTAPDERMIQLIDACIAGESSEALALLETSLQQGVQVGSFSDQLLGYLRDLLVAAAGADDVPLSSVSEGVRDQVIEQAKRWGLRTVTAAMQIVAEAKSRMFRVNYGRALLELALVRMASLEQLQEIANLLSAGSAVQSPSATGAGRPATGVKKNAESPPESLRTVQTERKESSQPQKNVELTESSLPQFWSAVLEQVPEMMAGHLKNASKTAIFGPNRLEIWFPKSYLFSKTYCERGETRKRLESVASTVAGTAVECRFSVDASTEPVKRTPPQKREPLVERRKPSAVENDVFVQQAVQVFGGQVVDVRPLPKEADATERPPEDDIED